jgi:hypothetical protein
MAIMHLYDKKTGKLKDIRTPIFLSAEWVELTRAGYVTEHLI